MFMEVKANIGYSRELGGSGMVVSEYAEHCASGANSCQSLPDIHSSLPRILKIN
jgi:hypothetical protein